MSRGLPLEIQLKLNKLWITQVARYNITANYSYSADPIQTKNDQRVSYINP